MEERRKYLGRRIKRARQRLGYDSQQSFADTIGVDKSGVSYAESGGDRIAVDGKIFAAIEDGLSWPEDCISRYLKTGDESLLPAPESEGARRPTPERARAEFVRRVMAIKKHYPQAYADIMRESPASTDDELIEWLITRE
jgi:transcriptional regulator with XRE-family HTH domain